MLALPCNRPPLSVVQRQNVKVLENIEMLNHDDLWLVRCYTTIINLQMCIKLFYLLVCLMY